MSSADTHRKNQTFGPGQQTFLSALRQMRTILTLLATFGLFIRCSEQNKCQDLVAAVESGLHRDVANILLDTSVDPSFNDHQLIRESKFCFGAKTTRHLLRDHRFDPAAHDNMFLRMAFKTGNIASVMLLLAHPKVDPACIEDLVEDMPDGDLKEMVECLNDRHIQVRSGLNIEDLAGLNVEAYITLLNTAILNGNVPCARKLFEISCLFKFSKHFDLALCLDHPETCRVGMEFDQKFKSRMSRIPFLDEQIGKLRDWKAFKSLLFVLEIVAEKDAELKSLLFDLTDPDYLEVNKAADKMIALVLNKYNNAEQMNIQSFVTLLASAAIFNRYVGTSNGVPAELSDQIFKHCI